MAHPLAAYAKNPIWTVDPKHTPYRDAMKIMRPIGYAGRQDITFGSDAHTPVDVGSGFQQSITMARQAGYTHFARFFGRQHTPVPLP